MKSVTAPTRLSASFDYELGAEDLYTHSHWGSGSEEEVYAKLLKVEITQDNTLLQVSFAGQSEPVDTTLWLIKKDESSYQREDNDNFNGNGEKYGFMLDKGIYYLALAGHDDDDIGLCHAEISAMPFGSTIEDSLDFTIEEPPTSGALWSWNELIQTLTLKDGFVLVCSEDYAITLPDGAIVVVEGNAVIISQEDDGIEVEGALTIEGRGAESSKLIIFAEDDGIDASGSVTVTKSTLNIAAELDSISCDGDTLIENSILELIADEGIDSEGVVTIISSTLDIISNSESISADNYDDMDTAVTISNSRLTLSSVDDNGIYADGDVVITDSTVEIEADDDDGIYAYGDVVITDSTLDITSDENGIYSGGNVTIEQNSKLTIHALDNDGIYAYGDVVVTDSTLYIEAHYKGIYSSEDITVTGGKLRIIADKYALDAYKITLSNLAFDLQTMDDEDYSLFDMDETDGFSLPGTFRLYDSKENELYMGEWDSERLQIDGGALYVDDGTEVFHAVSEGMYNGDFPIEWLGGLVPPLNSIVSYPFVDVPPMYYYFDAVNWAVENGITTGTGRLTFSPDAPCTRAQAVTFLWRTAGCPAPKSSEMPFTDVVAGSYYETAVLWAVEQGITKGTSDTTFSPNATCTRAQIVTFLCRAFGEASGAATPFADVAADAYYAGAVSWAAANGVTGGTSDTTFCPDAPCTRAQIVTFLYRFLS